MNVFKIIGESKPNKVRLKSISNRSTTELPKRTVRNMFETGIINIANPETLYVQL